MPRHRQPEEFFEVFRQVQKTKGAEPSPDAEEAPKDIPMPPQPPLTDKPTGRGTGFFAGPPVTLSRMAIFLGGCGVLLVVLIAFLGGRHSGWRESAPAAEETVDGEAAAVEEAEKKALESGAEFVKRKVFTMITLGTRPEHKEKLEREARFLNNKPQFRDLGLTAYVYRDSKKRYRLCARGLAAMSAEEREAVVKQVPSLKGTSGTDYRQAGYYAP